MYIHDFFSLLSRCFHQFGDCTGYPSPPQRIQQSRSTSARHGGDRGRHLLLDWRCHLLLPPPVDRRHAALRLSPVRPLGVGTWDLGRPYPPSSHLPRARSAGGSFCSRRVTAARRGLLLLDWIWVIAAWRLLPPCRCGGAAPFTTMRASVSNTSPSSRSASTTSQRCYLSSICVRFVFHPCDLCSFFVDLCFIHAIRIPFVLSNS